MAVDFRESISDPVALDVGNMTVQKGLVSKTIKMALFTDNRNAVWAAYQQLMKESYPFATISVPVNRNMFRLQVGDCFKFSYAPYNIENMIFRVLMIEEQSLASEIITVYAIEDFYSVTNVILVEGDSRDAPGGYYGDPYGNLYGCGDNTYSQLGIEDFLIGSIYFIRISTDLWSDISAGSYHSMAIKANGTLWATGLNSNGQLGLGDTTTRYEFTQVGLDSDWVQIVCGAYFTFAIKTNGEIWATGQNSSGQLGLGDTAQRTSLMQVSISNVESLACGESHTLLIKTNGTLWGSGDNSLGQLGMGAIGNVTSFTQIGIDTHHASIACGELHSALIKDNGCLYTTGYNDLGELGLGDDVDRNIFTLVGSGWGKVACGSYYTVALKEAGTLWGTGLNNTGQIGLGAIADVNVFTQIGSEGSWNSVECGVDSTYVAKIGGEVYATGSNEYGKLGINSYVIKVTTLQKIDENWFLTSGGFYHRLALKSDGTLWGVGYSYHGQLGIGNGKVVSKLTLCNEKTWSAVDCWGNHTMAIKLDGSLWGVGRNNFGQVGYGSGLGDIIYKFTKISADNWKQVACGIFHTACLKQNGTVWSTGHNYYGQLGVGDNNPKYGLVQMTGNGADSNWVFIAAGSYATMLIKNDGTLWVVGRNSGSSSGQLGLGDSIDRNEIVQAIGTGWKQVSIGACHAAAVRSDGTLWTTGRNHKGQLGQGDNIFRDIWTQVGSDTDWDYVECGADFTLAIKSNNKLYGTGYNYYGQLGLANNIDRNTFGIIAEDWNSDNYNDLPLFSGGGDHSLATYLDILKSTGKCIQGQLALGERGAGTDRNEFESIVHSLPDRRTDDSWSFVVCGKNHTMAINAGNFPESTIGCNLAAFTNKTIIEAPYLFTSDLAVVPIAAKASDINLGMHVHLSIDGGTSYLLIGSAANLRPHGTLVGTYPASTYTIDDTVGFIIDFTRDADLIETAIWPNVLAALTNNALLGDEFITFQTITPISGSQYKIEGIIRGRLDTEKVEHLDGEDFYYIGSANITNIKHSEIVAGADRKFKLVPYTLKCVGDLSEADVIDLSIGGRGKKPYVPRNFLANGSGFASRYSADIVLTWSPRYRGRGAGIGTPGEVLSNTDREGFFEIEVYVSDVLVRTTTAIDAATWTYTAVMNNADNGALADVVVFKLLNYRTENGYVYESDQVAVTCKKS